MFGRFQVMALLQAARAYRLGLSYDEARSFGLQRAVFYAAMKGRAPGRRSGPRPAHDTLSPEPAPIRSSARALLPVEDDIRDIQLDPRQGLRFGFGGRYFSPGEYDQRVARKFEDYPAWFERALAYVSRFPERCCAVRPDSSSWSTSRSAT